MSKKSGKIGIPAALAAFLASTVVGGLAATLWYWWISKDVELRTLIFWADDFGTRRAAQVIAFGVAGFVLTRYLVGYFLDEKPAGTTKHIVVGLVLALVGLVVVDQSSPDTIPALVRPVLAVWDKILG